MFDIGLQEILLISVIALLVLGPERLPVAVRTISLYIGRIRRGFADVKSELEREIGMDDIRAQLHNEEILKQLGETGDKLNSIASETHDAINTIQNPQRLLSPSDKDKSDTASGGAS